MSDERWKELMRFDELPLRPDEIAEGWHFCYDWDGLLIGPGMDELAGCTCPKPAAPIAASNAANHPSP